MTNLPRLAHNLEHQAAGETEGRSRLHMMVSDRSNDVVFLVTGEATGVVTVWAMAPKK